MATPSSRGFDRAGSLPVVRKVRWTGALPQFLALAAGLGLGATLSGSQTWGMLAGSAAYLAYSLGSRGLLARHHRRGIRLSRSGQFEAAICEYQRSYEFFTRHGWLDRFRCVFLMSASAMSYCEMALLNQAFCLSQIGRGAESKATYERALAEFPDSGMAGAALRLIRAAEEAALAAHT